MPGPIRVREARCATPPNPERLVARRHPIPARLVARRHPTPQGSLRDATQSMHPILNMRVIATLAIIALAHAASGPPPHSSFPATARDPPRSQAALEQRAIARPRRRQHPPLRAGAHRRAAHRRHGGAGAHAGLRDRAHARVGHRHPRGAPRRLDAASRSRPECGASRRRPLALDLDGAAGARATRAPRSRRTSR